MPKEGGQDITESLRIMAINLGFTSGQHTTDLLNRAANEIERLRGCISGFEKGLINAEKYRQEHASFYK